mgnify:CR=1 FL=1
MRVVRCDAVAMRSPVYNIYVDEDNTTYVANDEGVFRVFDLNLAEPINLPANHVSLLSFPGGNAPISWEEGALNTAIGSVLDQDNVITCTYYDAEKDDLWIGTSRTGLFRLRTQPRLQVQENLTERNSRLRSNYINTIHRDNRGTYWIGTRYGVLKGQNGRWDLVERDFNIEAIATDSSEVWFLGDDLVGYVDRRDTWYPIELPDRTTEGRLRNIIFDQSGNLWIASEILTRYHIETQAITVYGPAAYYTSEFASALAVNQDSALWVGTEDKGLYLIEKKSAMTVSLLVDREISCQDIDSGGALEVRITGGSEPYNIKWSMPALTGNTADQLAPGVYTVSVTDGAGKSKSATTELEDPRMTLTLTAQAPEQKPGAADGRALVEVEGGTPGYRFAWDNGESLRVASRLTGGKHTVTVTDSKGCTAVGEVVIGQEAADLLVEVAPSATLPCADANSGVLKASVQGGRAPYSYAWNTGVQTAEIRDIGAGSYSVTVTDAEGTQMTAEFLMVAPLPLEIDREILSPATTGAADGRARLTVQGGTQPYTFEWDNGETSPEAVRLSPGNHQVTITDANGCQTTTTLNVSEDIQALSASLQITQPVSCSGSADGALIVQVNGGKPPFQYEWNPRALTGAEVANLPAGSYQVTVTDAAGQQMNAQVDLSAPAALTAEAQATQPASTNGSDGQANVLAQGGTSPYTYRWDNEATTEEATGLTPGLHRVTVTDANGCSTTAEVAISEDILPLTASVTETALIKCAGAATASLTAKVNGGKGPFQYQWSNGATESTVANLPAGTYTVEVRDAEGTTTTASVTVSEPTALTAEAQATQPASTNGSDGQASVLAQGGTSPYTYRWDNEATTEEATGLTPGLHRVTVTDANGCSTTAEVAISEDILPLTASVTETALIKCAGAATASLTAKVNGGKGPFQYQWSNGATESTVANLPAGTYTVEVRDAEGTTTTASVTVSEPTALTAEAQATQPASTNGSDGQASVLAQGGTSPYTYRWDNEATTEEATGLTPGLHRVTVTDANGCSTTAEVAISEDILPLTASVTETALIKCAGAATASLTAKVNGGKGPFQYQWSNGATESTVANLPAGTYTVEVRDAEGTTTTASVTVSEPTALTAEAQATQPASTNGSDGQASVLAQGGTSPYTYRWDNEATTEEATGLTPGLHRVTVTDANGCSTTAEVAISEDILPLTASVTETALIKCAGAATASLTAKVNGGKGPFQYQWSNGSDGAELSGLTAGDYALTITDAKGTTTTASYSIPEPAQLEVTVDARQEASTDGRDGQAELNPIGGTQPYTYAWDNGETSLQATQLTAGLHQVTVTDANGCQVVTEVEIAENILPLTLTMEIFKPISCSGDADGEIATEVTGGKKPYTYNWGGDVSEDGPMGGLGPGTYQLTVTDASGQTASAQVQLTMPAPLSLEVVNRTPSSGGAEADGQAMLRIAGGTPDYQYAWSSGENTTEASRLDVGNQGVTVTDANGCQQSATFSVDKRQIPGLVSGQVSKGQTIQMEALRFDADSTNVKPEFYPLLDELYQFLNANPNISVEIGGHTNNIPPDFYCDELSLARAKSVADYLTRKGVPSSQVSYKGYGKREPIATNETPEGRRKNQRVEIKIVDVQE